MHCPEARRRAKGVKWTPGQFLMQNADRPCFRTGSGSACGCGNAGVGCVANLGLSATPHRNKCCASCYATPPHTHYIYSVARSLIYPKSTDYCSQRISLE